MPPSRPRIQLVELRRPSGNRLEALVLAGGRRQWLWFETDDVPLREAADAFLPVLLPAAMAAGLPLRIEAPLSPDLVEAARRVSRVLASWTPTWAELELEAAGSPAAAAIPAPSGAMAAFFSGGLDSFRTLQRYRAQLSHLLFVHGFDIALTEQDKADRVRRALSQVAAETGPSLLTVRTNLRAFTNRWVGWERHQCGAALAAVALLLAPQLRTVLIPSSRSLTFLQPSGTHPGLDSLWSLPGLSLRHDTLHEDRIDKLLLLAPWSLGRRQLRVCWQPRTPGLNCGRCQKCLSNQALLRGFCADQDWPTFPAHLDLQALARVQPHTTPALATFLKLRDHLRRWGHDPELLSAVEALLRRHRQRHPARVWRQQAVRALARLRA